MQPVQYDLRCPAAKDNRITHTAAAPSNLDAAITMRFAKTELPNPTELRATASEIAAPKPRSRRQSQKKWILKHFSKDKKNFTRKITSAKVEKICWQVTIAALMQPLQDNLRCPATVQLQNKIVLRTQLQLQATLTQPLQCDLHKDWVAKHNRTSRNGVKNCKVQNPISMPKQKKRFWSAF